MTKYLFVVILGLFIFAVAHAEETEDTTGNNKSSPDYYDGNTFDAQPVEGQQAAGAARAPSSKDLPYSDDELNKNEPENFKGKNMPIDQD